MPMPTKPSVSGFIASDPILTFTRYGDARFYARVGLHQDAKRDEEGNFHEVEPYFTDLIMFGPSAERAHETYQKDDNFIAQGQERTYTQNVNGKQVDREQFRASTIGPNGNITRFSMDRTPRERETPGVDATTREGTGQETPAVEVETAEKEPADPVTDVLAQRESQVAPEPATVQERPTQERETVAR
jgi:single-strand DNA-binding protein